jgi:hypothetical protein
MPFKRGYSRAFGLGIGALYPSIAGELPQPVKFATQAKKPSVCPVASARVLCIT